MAFLKSKSLTQSEFYLVFIPSLVFEVMATFISFNSTSKYQNRPTRLSTVFPSPKHLSPNSLFTNLNPKGSLASIFCKKSKQTQKAEDWKLFFFLLKKYTYWPILSTGLGFRPMDTRYLKQYYSWCIITICIIHQTQDVRHC